MFADGGGERVAIALPDHKGLDGPVHVKRGDGINALPSACLREKREPGQVLASGRSRLAWRDGIVAGEDRSRLVGWSRAPQLRVLAHPAGDGLAAVQWDFA